MADLPPCGLYKTGRPLPGNEDHLPAGKLVYFHNHSDSGSPIVCCPQNNEHNVWQFQTQGHRVDDPEFIGALELLMAEGLYVLKSHLHLRQDEVLPERTLVQLGYDRDAMPILFPGRFSANQISFPDKGLGFDSTTVFANLEPVNFLVPQRANEPLH